MTESSPSAASRRTKNSEETRRRILEVALELFRQRGFDATTMRDIASACGIALGATYYHFGSKEAIVLAYYSLAKDEMHQPLDEAVSGARSLAAGLRDTLRVKFNYFEPNRKFLGALFPHAADPRDPLSPFSDENRHIRRADQAHFQRLLERTTKLPPDLAPYVPSLLWLYQMGLLLFWIYDRTEQHRRTQALADKSLKIVVRLLQLSRTPMSRPLRKMAVELLETVTA